MVKKILGEFEVKREDPPDLPTKRFIDWGTRMDKLRKLVKTTKDHGWYVIGHWNNSGSAHYFRGKLEKMFSGFEFKAWCTTVGKKECKLYARVKYGSQTAQG